MGELHYKKLVKFSLITIGIIICIYSFLWIVYGYIQKRADQRNFQEWYNLEFKPSEYKGVLKYIDEGKGNLTLWIKTKETKQPITYVLCPNDKFKEQILLGDSVIKETNKAQLIFIDSLGHRKSLDLPFCK